MSFKICPCYFCLKLLDQSEVCSNVSCLTTPAGLWTVWQCWRVSVTASLFRQHGLSAWDRQDLYQPLHWYIISIYCQDFCAEYRVLWKFCPFFLQFCFSAMYWSPFVREYLQDVGIIMTSSIVTAYIPVQPLCTQYRKYPVCTTTTTTTTSTNQTLGIWLLSHSWETWKLQPWNIDMKIFFSSGGNIYFIQWDVLCTLHW